MALNNKNDRTITYLKATFFDLFRDHTGDVVKMIESLASGQPDDVVKVETAIFQRIILLNKTANNIEHLQQNVETLETLRTSDNVKEVTSPTKGAISSSQNPIQSSNEVVTSNSVKTPSAEGVNTPVAAATVKTPANPASDAPVTTVTSPVLNTPSASSQTVPVSGEQKIETPPERKVEVPVESKSGVLEKKEEIPKQVSEPIAVPSQVEDKVNLAKPVRFIKKSNKKAKAILANRRQYDKLMASRNRQFKLLDFGVSSTEATAARIERLMREASGLYKSGEVAKAQELYGEISALNKKLIQEQGKDKVLLKKAA